MVGVVGGAGSPPGAIQDLLSGRCRCRQPDRYPLSPMLRLPVAVPVLLAALLPAQNSTRKVRVPPSALAERAGTAVPWRDSVEAALAEARERGKPVFWYVPTVAGSPMDRQPEIDRYLLAGPFSWPSTIELLAQHFVPVRAVPRGELQQRLKLRRGEFIEPGWIVLGGDGTERARLQQITTLQPQWFEAPLRRLVGQPDPGFVCGPALREAWDDYRTGDGDGALAAIARVLAQGPADDAVAEALFLRGVVQRTQNRVADAVAAWRSAGERAPESTWAWKAAMEAEGHGPFARGFEDYLSPPERTRRDLDEGSRAPRGTFTQAQLWQRGVRFLLRMAEDDGILRDSTYDFGGTDSLPNVHIAISFLAGEALLAALQRAGDGRLDLAEADRARAGQRLDALLAAAADGQRFATRDGDEIVWAYGYRVRGLARWIQLRPADRARLLPRLQDAVEALLALQPDDGIWFHEYPNPFATATALQVLAMAREAAAAVDPERGERGARALIRCRSENGAYTYGAPGRGRARAGVPGAAGRMPLCEQALLLWGKAGQPELRAALTAAFEHHGLLAAVRKYDDHADAHGYGGFFFWFDMLGRAEAVMRLDDATQRGLWQAQQKKLVLDLPEFDGCFVDSHELGRAYGTAMALLCLHVLDP
jgi:hypothetical protein